MKADNAHLAEGLVKLKEKPKTGNKNKKKKAVVSIAKLIATKKPKGKYFKC